MVENTRVAGILVTVLVLMGASCGLANTFATWKLARLVMCDVGQGDGLLISQGFFQIVVDAGPDTKFLECLKKNLPWFDQTIEIVIATHADLDHIGGMAAVLEAYQIRTLITPAWGRKTQAYQAFLAAARVQIEQGAVWRPPRVGDKYRASPNFSLTLISPASTWGNPELFDPRLAETQLLDILERNTKDKRATNDGSIGILVVIGGVEFLLTGDMELEAEKAALERGVIPDVDILKVGHHGSKTSTGPDFLRAGKPEVALVSVGRSNRYGHPDAAAIERLRSLGADIWRTDEEGKITVWSNGSNYVIESHKRGGVRKMLSRSKLLLTR